MAGGDLGAQQRRRVVDFVRLLDATEKTLEQGVLASARPGDRAYLLELNRLHVVRFVGRGGECLCVGAQLTFSPPFLYCSSCGPCGSN